MTTHPEAFKRLDPAIFRISSYTDTKTPKEARQYIKDLLQSTNFMVNVSPVTRDELLAISDGSPLPEFLYTAAVETGMVWANCCYDGTENTGVIVNGQPVCFDTVSGRCVTGINPNWDKSEYKVVGTAWKSWSTPGFGRIPITLTPPSTEAEVPPVNLRRAELTTSLSLGGSAEALVVEWDGINWVTTEEEVELFDSLNRFTGDPGQRFWFTEREDSAKREIVAPAKTSENLRRVQLETSLSLGGSAVGKVVEWDEIAQDWMVTLEVVEVFDSLNRFTGVPGDRFWFTRPIVSNRNEFVSPTKPGTPTDAPLIRFRLKTALALGGDAEAYKLIWDANSGEYVTAGEIVVREFTVGDKHFTAGVDAEGWGILMADRNDAYEIVWIEMKARFTRTHATTGPDVNDKLTVVQDYFWMGYNPAIIETWDEDKFFPRILPPMPSIRSAAKQINVLDEQTGRYRTILSHSQAGWAIFECENPFEEVDDTEDPDDGLVRSTACFLKHYGGTQQDIQNPGDSLGSPRVNVYDKSGKLEGRKISGIALLSAEDGRYYAAPEMPPVTNNFAFTKFNMNYTNISSVAEKVPYTELGDQETGGTEIVINNSPNYDMTVQSTGSYFLLAQCSAGAGGSIDPSIPPWIWPQFRLWVMLNGLNYQHVYAPVNPPIVNNEIGMTLLTVSLTRTFVAGSKLTVAFSSNYPPTNVAKGTLFIQKMS